MSDVFERLIQLFEAKTASMWIKGFQDLKNAKNVQGKLIYVSVQRVCSETFFAEIIQLVRKQQVLGIVYV